MLAVRYLTDEWATQALEVMETDVGVKEALAGAKVSILTIVTGPPEDCYSFMYAAFDEGGLKEYRVGHDYHSVTDGIEAPTFVVSGPYEIFASIQQGNLTERRAILTGRLQLTGSLTKALRYMKALEGVSGAMRGIDCIV